METIRLPSEGQVRIGRSVSCGAVIDDASIAEEHALLQIGPTITLVDLGSGLSTAVGQEPLTPGVVVTLGPGSVFTLGALTLVVQVGGASTRLRHVRSHDYFEARLEDECARAEGGTSPGFSIARLVCAPGCTGAVEAVFSDRLRAMDVVATYTPNEYELLLVDLSPTRARAMVDDLERRITISGASVSIGFASYPRDARTPEALFVAAATRTGMTLPPPSAPAMSVDAMERLSEIVTRIAPINISVLIIGETGVGKEVTAKAIHRRSPRSSKPMLCINCAAFTENLLESELFGYERGAFTGAVAAKPGLLETADGGSVFLDEVGEMPPTIQAKLLRVLEDKKVSRLGALSSRPINVRFISATNRDLDQLAQQGLFRSDLYFRLNGFLLEVPPLRERAAEINSLANTFIAEASAQADRATVPTLSREAFAALERYMWPGNVRELKNVIERAVLLCTGDVIDPIHLPLDKMGRTLPSISAPPMSSTQPTPQAPPGIPIPIHGLDSNRPPSMSIPLPAIPTPPVAMQPVQPVPNRSGTYPRRDDEREKILSALDACGGNQTKAAKLLGISRNTLIARLDAYAVPRPKKTT
jgi:DNA-binding NtrC family response regulator